MMTTKNLLFFILDEIIYAFLKGKDGLISIITILFLLYMSEKGIASWVWCQVWNYNLLFVNTNCGFMNKGGEEGGQRWKGVCCEGVYFRGGLV